MFLAQEFDADGFVSAGRSRLLEPDLRGRVVGYLAHAPLVEPGWRTDGEWVWPEALAEHLRTRSVLPQRQLVDHIRERWVLLPDALWAGELDEDTRARARAALVQPPLPDPDLPQGHIDWTYFGRDEQSGGPTVVRRGVEADGTVTESAFYPSFGWDRSSLLSNPTVGPSLREVSLAEATEILDRLVIRSSADMMAELRETQPGPGPRVARTFDRELRFSPLRVRIPEQLRRERLARYLSSGAIVLRAAGGIADPLDPTSGRRVPLTFRTDGVWVWQEALAHFVLHHGIAPEVELLAHIEERAAIPPGDIPDELVEAAAVALRAGVQPVEQQPVTYWKIARGFGHTTLVRHWDLGRQDMLTFSLGWKPTTMLDDWKWRGSGDFDDVQEISEVEASQIVDERRRSPDLRPPAF